VTLEGVLSLAHSARLAALEKQDVVQDATAAAARSRLYLAEVCDHHIPMAMLSCCRAGCRGYLLELLLTKLLFSTATATAAGKHIDCVGSRCFCPRSLATTSLT